MSIQKKIIKQAIVIAIIFVSVLILHSCSKDQSADEPTKIADSDLKNDANADSSSTVLTGNEIALSNITNEDYVPVAIAQLLGNWQFDSGTFELVSYTGVDNLTAPVTELDNLTAPVKGQPIEIKEDGSSYLVIYNNAMAFKVSEINMGADAIKPQKVTIGPMGYEEEPVIMDLEHGTVRKLKEGKIHIYFHLTGTDEHEGEELELNFKIEGLATKL